MGNHWLKPVEICDVVTLEILREPILQAIREIGERSGRNHRPEKVFGYIRDHQIGRREFALFLAIDRRLSGSASVCGVQTIQVCIGDLGEPVAFIGFGWIRKGYRGEPFVLSIPTMKVWARDRGCRRILTQTERSSAAAAAERLDMRNLTARLRGLAAYAKWASRCGFVMRECLFELDLEK